MDEAFIPMVKNVPGLMVDEALAMIGGSEDVYEKLLRVFVRQIPETITLMKQSLESGNLAVFALKTHGLRGSLNQSGYSSLGKRAEQLELAAKSGDMEYCISNYGVFKDDLTSFYNTLSDIMEKTSIAVSSKKTSQANLHDYLDKLKSAVAAAEALERKTALDALAPLQTLVFGEPWDGRLAAAVEALELFKPFDAADYLQSILTECIS